MRKVITIWSVLTFLLTGAFYRYIDSFPPEEHFDLANSVGFKLIVSVIVVGGIAAIALFAFLFFGSIIRSLWKPK